MKSLIIFFISFVIFVFLETGFKIRSAFGVVYPLIFSICTAVSINKIYRNYLIITSFLLLLIMVILYLFWQMDLSNWFGSLGIGIFTIAVLANIPELIKKGNIER